MSDDRPFDTVAIVGLGLMGGSLAGALVRLPQPPRVRASSRDPDVIARARADGAAHDVVQDALEAIEGADVVVYATPVGVTVDLLARHAAVLRNARLVTDVASVKAPIVAAARAAGIGERFVGGHPMCGKEQSGYAAADSGLFAGATVWLVPAVAVAPMNVAEALWRAVGAKPRVTTADAHDRLVAWSSHLPQLVASALAAALRGAQVSTDSLGPGGRDMTRLARSPAELWSDILAHNSAYVNEALVAMIARLAAAADAVRREDRTELERLFSNAHEWTQRP